MPTHRFPCHLNLFFLGTLQTQVWKVETTWNYLQKNPISDTTKQHRHRMTEHTHAHILTSFHSNTLHCRRPATVKLSRDATEETCTTIPAHIPDKALVSRCTSSKLLVLGHSAQLRFCNHED